MKKILLLIMLTILISLFKVSSVQAQAPCPTLPTNTGTIIFSATTTAGTYRVWNRMKSADTNNNSFYLKIDNNCPVLVGDSSLISNTTWTWVDYQEGNTSSKIDINLTAGIHVITLIGNEPGVIIDKVLMTKNLSCLPVDFGTNCPSELPTSTPTPTPQNLNTVTVSSIVALKTALSDNSLDEIVIANGIYHVSGASNQYADSLWIDQTYASRTRPILVRAQTTGGVTFDGGGSTYWIGLAFLGGVHDQTWQGFKFANGKPIQTGVITFGWGGSWSTVASHHITLRDITIMGSVTSDNPPGTSGDHGIYFSQSIGGNHDILIDGLAVDGSGGLDSALHFYHSVPGEPNAWNVTVRRMNVIKTDQAIILWDATLRNVLIEDSTISNPIDLAIRYETTGASGIVLKNIVSDKGFYSSQGNNPVGVSFINNSFNCPSCLNTQTPTPTVFLTATPFPTYTPTPTTKPTLTPTPTLTPSPTPKPTATPTPTPPTPTNPPLSGGDGFLGMYYSNRNLSGTPIYRIDPNINFDWRKNSPINGLDPNNFSVRWSGYILPKTSETYTIYARSDDGVRVWINNQLIIDAWNDHSATEFSGNIFLNSGVKYLIKVEYYEKNAYATAKLSWSSPTVSKIIIPQNQLYTYK